MTQKTFEEAENLIRLIRDASLNLRIIENSEEYISDLDWKRMPKHIEVAVRSYITLALNTEIKELENKLELL